MALCSQQDASTAATRPSNAVIFALVVASFMNGSSLFIPITFEIMNMNVCKSNGARRKCCFSSSEMIMSQVKTKRMILCRHVAHTACAACMHDTMNVWLGCYLLLLFLHNDDPVVEMSYFHCASRNSRNHIHMRESGMAPFATSCL